MNFVASLHEALSQRSTTSSLIKPRGGGLDRRVRANAPAGRLHDDSSHRSYRRVRARMLRRRVPLLLRVVHRARLLGIWTEREEGAEAAPLFASFAGLNRTIEDDDIETFLPALDVHPPGQQRTLLRGNTEQQSRTWSSSICFIATASAAEKHSFCRQRMRSNASASGTTRTSRDAHPIKQR